MSKAKDNKVKVEVEVVGFDDDDDDDSNQNDEKRLFVHVIQAFMEVSVSIGMATGISPCSIAGILPSVMAKLIALDPDLEHRGVLFSAMHQVFAPGGELEQAVMRNEIMQDGGPGTMQ